MLCLSAVFHPVHVSVNEINYSVKDKAIQITSRIFADDLEAAIRLERKDPALNLLEPKNGHTTDELLAEYLSAHFRMKLEGKSCKTRLLGHEVDEMAVVCYIEIAGVKKIKTLDVFNDVITELYGDQSNIIHVTYQGPVKSVRLTAEEREKQFTF